MSAGADGFSGIVGSVGSVGSLGSVGSVIGDVAGFSHTENRYAFHSALCSPAT